MRRKWPIQERLAALTPDELARYYNLLWSAPADMTTRQFLERHPLPIDEYGVRR